MDCQPQNEIHYNIELEALYWQARENGIEFAIKSKNRNFRDGKFKTPDFSNRLGFRVSFAYLLPSADLKFNFCFTHFHARTNSHLHADENEFFFPVWTHPNVSRSGFVDEVESRWRLHLGFGDADVYKHFDVSSWFSLDPHVGLRYAEVRQKYRIDYRGGTLFPNGEDDISMKNKFWGIGPRAGCRGDFRLIDQLYFFADFALSILYGKFYVHQDEEIEGNEETLKLLDTFTQSQVISEARMGLSYIYRLSHLALHFSAGYEIDYLFGQNQWMRFLSSSQPAIFASNLGDLSLQGWSVSFQIDF